MPADERVKIIEEFKCVDYVIKAIDTDRTVCKNLETIEPKPHFFCNGGDQSNNLLNICEFLIFIPDNELSKNFNPHSIQFLDNKKHINILREFIKNN